MKTQEFKKNLLQTACHFRVGFEAEGNHYLEKCLVDLGEILNEDEPNNVCLVRLLTDLYRAQNQRDLFGMADIIEYKIIYNI